MRARFLGVAGKCAACLFTLALASASVGCSDDGGGDDDETDGEGGAGGSGGASGGAGGRGGNAGSAGGSGGGSSDGGTPDGAAGGSAGMAPPPFMLETGNPLANNGTLPITVDFANATDLSGKFKVYERAAGAVAHDAAEGGRVKFVDGKQGVLFYDTTPDDTGTVGFEEFTATLTFKSAGMPNLYFLFGGDDKRADARQVTMQFDNGRPGPVGIADVDGFFYSWECSPQYWKAVDTICLTQLAKSYAFGSAAGGTSTYKFELTVKKGEAGQLVAYGAYWQDGEFIDHQVYTFANATRTTGEIAFGARPVGGDLYVDELKIEAAKAIPDFGVRTHKGDDGVIWSLWLPEGAAPVNGLIHFAPSMVMPAGATGEFALFDHHRRFATAHRWGLLSSRGTTMDMVASADAALAALATASGHAEVKTVPLFVESLLNNFAHTFAHAHPEKTIGFVLNKPEMGLTYTMPTDASRAVPGLITFSPLSAISNVGSSSPVFNAGRMGGGLWATAAHGSQTHAVVDTFALYYTMLERLIALRMTNGAPPLKPVDKTKGWLGVHRPILMENFAAVEAYPGTDDPMRSWLPDEHVATIFSAFHYMRFAMGTQNFLPKPAFFLAAPKHGKAGDSRTMRLGFDAGFMWKKIEFFDMGGKRGEIAAGAMPEFTYSNLAKGAHAFTARVTDGADKIHMVHPAMAIMAP